MNILEGCRHQRRAASGLRLVELVYGANTRCRSRCTTTSIIRSSLYAATKKANELMAHTYSHLYGLPTTGLRFFTVYGPWGRPDMALFLFTKAILEGRPIDVFNHGKMRRDFTYIDDIVEGVVRMTDHVAAPDPAWDGRARSRHEQAPYRIYNIGNNQPVELMTFIATIESELGRRRGRTFCPCSLGTCPKPMPTLTRLWKAWASGRGPRSRTGSGASSRGIASTTAFDAGRPSRHKSARRPSPMPKLLFLVSEDWYFVSHRLPLAVAAKNAGFDVAVVTRVGEAGGKIKAAGVRLIPVSFNRSGINPLDALKTLADLRAIYRAEAPDIVHHVAMKPVVYGSIAAMATGIQNRVNALMGLGYVFASSDLKARLLRAPVKMLLAIALKAPRTRIIVQNRDDLEFFAGTGLARAQDLRLIRGSGVDPDQFLPADAAGNGPPVVVLPARMLRDKGVVEFVEAARLLKTRGVAARFVLCGEPDPLNPASLTQAQLAEFTADGDVEYWGWQRDMMAVWKAAQVVCLPSYREGLPKALLEAAACSLPLVATDVPGCREIVRREVNGWLVPKGDSAALAAALDEAIARKDLRVRYGQASRLIIERKMSLDQVMNETIQVYCELLGHSPRVP